MKKIVTSLMIMLVCISGFISAYAANQASGDKNNPTALTVNEGYSSYIYTGHPADYYTFTLNSKNKVLIECYNVSNTTEYKMTLSGNGIEPIFTTDATDTTNYKNSNEKKNTMYLTAELNAGTYNVSVEGDFASRATTEDISYEITVYNTLKTGGNIVNSSDYVFVNDDFENGNTDNWLDGFRPHYVYGNKTTASETNGNKYAVFTPVNNTQYYIFEAKDVYATKLLCSEFDIKFSNQNMELQLRETDSNLSTNFKMAGRLRKFANYLQYYSDGAWKYMFDSYGQWLQLNTNTWYTIRMSLDIETNKYSLYLENRDSGAVLSKVESMPFAQECNSITYYAFSSQGELDVDNVKIFETNSNNIDVEGWTYVKIPSESKRQYNYFNPLSVSEKAWSADQWTLFAEKSGVSIDKDTGILSVSNEAKPGSVVIVAAKKYMPWIKSTYLVDLDR